MLSQLEPQSLFQIFQEICAIPHPSHHEEAISTYIINFANKHNLTYEVDETGNIIIRKSASAGYENVPSLALQAHMDMVPQKNNETNHDFLVDPIEPLIDGEWVTANNTTLGADNGIGLASILAIFSDSTLGHGPLEALITKTEEDGMVGAFGLQAEALQSHYLLNTDSEESGEIITGCAGGVNFTASFPITYGVIPNTHDTYIKLTLKGLKGGHSGCDINKGHVNSIKLLARFLSVNMQNISYRISVISGGSLRNAIPREANVEFCITKADVTSLEKSIERFKNECHSEFYPVEDEIDLSFEFLPEDHVNRVMLNDQQQKLIHWLNAVPNGVIAMDNQNNNIVETSLNIGVVSLQNNAIKVQNLIRSQLDSARNSVVSQLSSLCDLGNINYEVSGEYSGWKPEFSSALLTIAKQSHDKLFNSEPKVTIIHAGLECGLFKNRYPDMDMISIGPTIISPHSPAEKVNIESVMHYWTWLKEIIINMKNMA